MKYFWVVSFLLISFISQSQIVDIEGKRVDNKSGFFGEMDFNFTFTQNAASIWQLNSRIKAGYVSPRHMVLFLNEINLVKAGEENFINSGFLHLRYNYTFKDSGFVKFELFQQSQYNKIQKIQSRILLGAGVRFELFQYNEKITMNTGLSVMGENEELTDDTNDSNFRFSTYFNLDWKISELIKLSTITYYQPRADHIADYRLSHLTSILFSINKYIGFKVNYQLVHDSTPAADVRKTNYKLQTGIQFRL